MSETNVLPNGFEVPELKLNLTKTKLNPRRRKLKPGARIYNGSEITKDKKILTKYNDIREGVIIDVVDAFGQNREAKCDCKKEYYVSAIDTKTKFRSYQLEFDIDDRHCWVCTCTNHIAEIIDIDSELLSITTEEHNKEMEKTNERN